MATTKAKLAGLQLTNTKITKSSLLKIHQKQLDNHENNEHNLYELLDVFGGIDQILHEYLQNNTIQLTDEQLENIHQIINPSQSPINLSITTNHTITRLPTTVLSPQAQTQLNQPLNPNSQPPNDLESVTTDAFYYVFDENKTYLHKYFGKQTTAKLLSILHNKFIHVLMGITMTLYLVLLLLFFGALMSAILSIICSVFLWIPFCCLWLLSVNIEGGRIVCKTIDFWFKLVCAFGHVITVNIIYFGYRWNEWENATLSMIATILMGIVIILGIAVVSLFDAVKMNKIWKIIVSGLCALLAILWTISQQFTAYQAGEVFVEISGEIGFSLIAINISTTRVLAIFLAKQAYNTWQTTKKNQCGSMKYKLSYQL